MERFDAAAVRRILARTDSNGDLPVDEIERGVDAEALTAAAVELGYRADEVRLSIAHERLGDPPPSTGVLDHVAGAGRVSAEAVVSRTAEQALDTAAAWFERAHRMSCRRVDDHTLTARRRRDLGASVGRSLTDLRGDGRLGRVHSITVTVVSTGEDTPDPSSCASGATAVVRITADRRPQRQQRAVAGGLLTTTGAAAAAVGVAESMFAWPVAAVALGGAGVVTLARGHTAADRAEHELEELLDAIGRGEAPVGTLRKLARAARRSASA